MRIPRTLPSIIQNFGKWRGNYEGNANGNSFVFRRVLSAGIIVGSGATAFYYYQTKDSPIFSNRSGFNGMFTVNAANKVAGPKSSEAAGKQGEMASQPLKAIVFMGSVRDGRHASRVAKFVTNKLTEAKYEVEVWDPQELGLPLLKQPLQFYPDPKQAPKILQDLNEKIKAADVFVVLTAEYNRQMPPALTNLLDHFPPVSYAFKASSIVSYSMGPGGGTTAASQARTLMVEFGAPPIPYVLSISQVQNSLDESGKVQNEYLHKSATKMMTQLNWYANAFRNQRLSVGAPAWEGPVVSV